MEISRLETLYTANLTDLDRKSAQAENRLRQVSKQAGQTEKAINRAFVGPVADPLKKLQKEIGASSDKLKAELLGLRTSVSTLDGPLGAVGSRLSSLTSLLTGATTATGGFGLAIGAAAAAAVGAGAAIYSLTTSVAESTGKFKDLSQQTGFSVETLSALSNAAETSGGSIESVTSALFLFETKMGEAKDTTSEMGKLFKALNIDTKDNEKALRQALDALSKMTSAEDKATIGKKLFGRSVKDLLGALAEAGSLDAFLNDQLRRGTLITTEAADRGDQLSDSVVEMGRAFESTRRIVADEFGPDVLSAVKLVTGSIENNRDVIRDWASTFGDATRGAYALAQAVNALSGGLLQLAGIGIPEIISLLAQGSITGLLPIIGRATSGGSNTVGQSTQNDMLRMDNLLKRPGYRTPDFQGAIVNSILGGNKTIGGGGGRGGGRSWARTDPGVELLKRLQDEYKKLAPLSDLQRIQEQLLGKEFNKTSDSLKKKIELEQMEIDIKKLVLSVSRDRVVSLANERKEFEKLVDLTREAGDKGLPFFTRDRLANPKAADRPRIVGEGKWGADDLSTWAFGKIGKDDQLHDATNRIAEFAGDITNIFGTAFDNIGRDWKGMLNSLVRDLQGIGSRLAQDQLFKLLSGIGSRSGGSNVFTKDVGADVMVSGKRALGGPVETGRTYLVGEYGPELFTARQGGSISPSGQSQLGGQSTSRFFFVDDERAAFEKGATRKEIFRIGKQMRKIGKVISV